MAQKTLKDDLQEKLTKREYFAILAMQGLLANHQTTAYHEEVPISAVALADALIEALNK
jgi:hypothetical protein